MRAEEEPGFRIGEAGYRLGEAGHRPGEAGHRLGEAVPPAWSAVAEANGPNSWTETDYRHGMLDLCTTTRKNKCLY